MGDFIGGVYVCLPLVGGKNSPIGDLKKGTCLSLKLHIIVDCCSLKVMIPWLLIV
jgi:hypothetical protein